jgi:hypothetical protein
MKKLLFLCALLVIVLFYCSRESKLVDEKPTHIFKPFGCSDYYSNGVHYKIFMADDEISMIVVKYHKGRFIGC